jgi:hypothetical protein
MSCYIEIVLLDEESRDLDNQKVTLLGIDEERALALFSSPQLCDEFEKAFPCPVEPDGARAISWECDRAELTDLVELLNTVGIEFIVFNPQMVSDRHWSSELAPMHLDTFLALLKGELPMPEEIATDNVANIADHRSTYPEELPIETRSSISRLKNVLDDVRAMIEEWEI